MYAPACDNWAAGVLLFNMLAGDLPFDNDVQIKMGDLCFYQNVWKAVSVDAKVGNATHCVGMRAVRLARRRLQRWHGKAALLTEI